MRDVNSYVNKERIIIGAVTAVALFCVGVGLASVLSDSKNYENNKNNVVDLGEGSENVADNDMWDDVILWSPDEDDEDADVGRTVSNNNAQVAGITDEDASDDSGMNGGNNAAVSEATKENSMNGEDREVAAGVATDPLSAYSFNKASVLMWPVNGAIVMNYSMDSTVLHKTLGIYKTNPAILIGSTIGEAVEAAASGIVQTIYESEETGTTVEIAVGDGYVTTYGLLDNVAVKEGEAVIAGQELGTVGAPTAYYVEEGPNVYFAVTKDGEPVDPSEFLATE